MTRLPARIRLRRRLLMASAPPALVKVIVAVKMISVVVVGNSAHEHHASVDIGALSGLTNLTDLNIGSNSISDITAFGGLTNLSTLYLYYNASLSNIQPLLDNTGLGAGDEVYLTSTNVSCTDVALLEAKGVTVSSDCS